MKREPIVDGAARRALALAGSLMLAAALAAYVRGAEPGAALSFASRPRGPVALCLSSDGGQVFVANRRSGSLSIIDPVLKRVVAEFDVGRGLSDVASTPHGRHLIAVDQDGDAVLLIEVRGGVLHVLERRAIAADPVRVLISVADDSIIVASRWSRRLTFLHVSDADRTGKRGLTVDGTLDLPFSPRDLALVRAATRLVAADAFGGRLAVVDPKERTLEAVRTLPAHNIRGLAVAPDGRTLLLAHQVLHRLARSSFEDIHWGSLLSNHLRRLDVHSLVSPGDGTDFLRGSVLIDLGTTGHGSGDPAGLVVAADGAVAVALAGVDEVAFGPDPTAALQRVGAGRRPTALALSPDGSALYVADTLDDTVTVVELPSGRRLNTIALGPRPEPTLAERGERLFHDARLAHDGWMSCHSCHTDGHTNGLRADTLGDGSYGASKRVPSLLGVGGTGPWGWLGMFERLQVQVRNSIETTMHGKSPTDEQVEALNAFLQTLAPPRGQVPPERSEAAARGRAVFETRKCGECHTAPEYTSTQNYDVGLVDEAGNRRFNPPTLRGVGVRAPLLHDGRAATLEAVFAEHHHPRGMVLSPAEIEDLAAFLRTL